MGETTRVTTEELYSKSIELQEVIKSATVLYEEIHNLINASAKYWGGKAGEQVRRIFSDLNQDVTEVLDILDTYPEKLQRMSGIYEERHKQAVTEATVLPGDVI